MLERLDRAGDGSVLTQEQCGTDQSVLPAAGDAAVAPLAQGANFLSVSVDPLSTPNPLPLLGPEDLPRTLGHHPKPTRYRRHKKRRRRRRLRRKIAGRQDIAAAFEAPLARASQIRSQQQRQRGWK